MDISYDPAKSRWNETARGISFEDVHGFDFETAIFRVDDRRDYGEIRYRGLGRLHGRVHSLVFTETETGIRVISFRKANAREVQAYEKATQP